jgi:predicted small integral membrane protein
MMLIIRLTQSLFIAYIGAFGLLVAFGNITDYSSNFAFVQHVMSMDTIFPESRLRYRAITSPALHHAAYWVIILGETLTGLLCSVGALRLFRCLQSDAASFHRAKSMAALGLAVAFTVWFLGFIVIGGEWFAMWQSAQWNGQAAATRFLIPVGTTLLLLAHRE